MIFHINTIILNKVGNLSKKCDFWVKIMIFVDFSLGAKFNRFFIILGGVPIYGKNRVFLVKKPGVLLAFFGKNLVPDIRADGTPYTVGGVKIVDFG